MDTKIEFLYLSEADMIAAGVNDSRHCISVCEEVFGLLAKGDYLMGGSGHNSHGMGIIFPKETPFPNMPVAGPDRRFFAMPAYLGGRFDVCGCKWYGSNAANTSKGLPRSILMMNLNDKDTGAPLAYMSANLLSAARTGAVPAVAAKYLAKKGAKTAAIIGCGPINRSCFRHIAAQLNDLEKVYCFDIMKDKAADTAGWAKENFGIEGIAVDELPDALKNADVVTVAASRIKPLYIENSWLKKGSCVLLTGPAKGDDDLWLKNKIVYDHIGLHENYVAEAIESGDKDNYYNGVIGGPIYHLIDEGKLPALKESVSLGMMVNGDKTGRENDEDIYIFVACGMAVFDVAVSYEVYQEALKKGIGQKLLLWDTPAL
ncbi:MAG: ornithine cyclodeaminase [Lachnospiraceae bacterium]|nr:ornithine cyclodeaminase [Lachnospiraceae bacterium]